MRARLRASYAALAVGAAIAILLTLRSKAGRVDDSRSAPDDVQRRAPRPSAVKLGAGSSEAAVRAAAPGSDRRDRVVRGRVRRPSGRRVEGLEVRASLVAFIGRWERLETPAVTTDRDGGWEIAVARAWSRGAIKVAGDGVWASRPMSPNSEEPLEIVLRDEPSITGTVYDDEQRPLAGQFLTASGDFDPITWMRTDASGDFSFYAGEDDSMWRVTLPPGDGRGEYTVSHVRAGTHVALYSRRLARATLRCIDEEGGLLEPLVTAFDGLGRRVFVPSQGDEHGNTIVEVPAKEPPVIALSPPGFEMKYVRDYSLDQITVVTMSRARSFTVESGGGSEDILFGIPASWRRRQFVFDPRAVWPSCEGANCTFEGLARQEYDLVSVDVGGAASDDVRAEGVRVGPDVSSVRLVGSTAVRLTGKMQGRGLNAYCKVQAWDERFLRAEDTPALDGTFVLGGLEPRSYELVAWKVQGPPETLGWHRAPGRYVIEVPNGEPAIPSPR
jgi:hypothetical protein